jgi:hypothetical protein
MQLRGCYVHARQMPDRRLRLVRHEFRAVRLGEHRATQHAGNAAHLDDIRLHHRNAGEDQVRHRGRGVALLAAGDGDRELARDLARRAHVLMLHRLLEHQ